MDVNFSLAAPEKSTESVLEIKEITMAYHTVLLASNQQNVREAAKKFFF